MVAHNGNLGTRKAKTEGLPKFQDSLGYKSERDPASHTDPHTKLGSNSQYDSPPEFGAV